MDDHNEPAVQALDESTAEHPIGLPEAPAEQDPIGLPEAPAEHPIGLPEAPADLWCSVPCMVLEYDLATKYAYDANRWSESFRK